MDAEVAYAFHSERQNHPEKFKNQFTNQVDNGFFVLFPEHYRHANMVFEIPLLSSDLSVQNLVRFPDYCSCFTAVSICKVYMQARLVLCTLHPL